MDWLGLNLVRLLGLALLLGASTARADEREQLAQILALHEPPTGVVFEIVGGDAGSLGRALDRITGYAGQLHDKFQGLPVVILTHGMEQFTLLRENAQAALQLHRQVQRLVESDNIPVQVCGAFARMNGVGARDFTDKVEVVANAPAQIEEYRYRGYVVLEMELK